REGWRALSGGQWGGWQRGVEDTEWRPVGDWQRGVEDTEWRPVEGLAERGVQDNELRPVEGLAERGGGH
ncbi:unnamed protein product, partial [Staurois parvus]